jgi:hypothetical protein
LWCGDLKIDEPYTSASIVEAWSATPAGFNGNPHKQFLLRIAGDKDGNVSAKKLGEWLHRNCGRVVRASDGRKYWLIRGQARTHRAAFRLSEVKGR